MARTITLTASLTPEDGGYVARCVELDVTSEGDTVEEALMMLREAVELYLEDAPIPDQSAHNLAAALRALGKGAAARQLEKWVRSQRGFLTCSSGGLTPPGGIGRGFW